MPTENRAGPELEIAHVLAMGKNLAGYLKCCLIDLPSHSE
jgi:hypothetical protein